MPVFKGSSQTLVSVPETSLIVDAGDESAMSHCYYWLSVESLRVGHQRRLCSVKQLLEGFFDRRRGVSILCLDLGGGETLGLSQAQLA